MSPAEVTASFIEIVWNQGDLDRIPEFISPEYRIEGVVVGRGWVWDNVTTFRKAFSDLKLTIERMVASGNDVAIMVRLDGRHTGTMKGFAATGREVSYREAQFLEFDTVADAGKAAFDLCAVGLRQHRQDGAPRRVTLLRRGPIDGGIVGRCHEAAVKKLSSRLDKAFITCLLH